MPAAAFNIDKQFTTMVNPFVSGLSVEEPLKFTSVVRIIKFTTDKKSVGDSEKLLKLFKKMKKDILPKEISIEVAKSNLPEANKAYQTIQGFFDVVNRLGQDGEHVDIDEPNASRLFNNLKECQEILDLMSDVFNLVIQTHDARESHKTAKVYTPEEFLKKFAV